MYKVGEIPHYFDLQQQVCASPQPRLSSKQQYCDLHNLTHTLLPKTFTGAVWHNSRATKQYGGQQPTPKTRFLRGRAPLQEFAVKRVSSSCLHSSDCFNMSANPVDTLLLCLERSMRRSEVRRYRSMTEYQVDAGRLEDGRWEARWPNGGGEGWRRCAQADSEENLESISSHSRRKVVARTS